MEKKLYRSRENKILCGVCGGIAEYLNADASIVRLIAAAICLSGGFGLMLYIIGAIVIPEDVIQPVKASEPVFYDDVEYREVNEGEV